jgi:hypothetical protein
MSRHPLLSGLAIAVVAATAGCSAGPAQSMPRRHLSATEHHTEAQRHEREASARERTAQVRRRREASGGGGDEYGCYDREVPDPDLGGERVQVLRPCWTAQTRQPSPDQTDAAEHRRLARKHREQAEALTRAERRACTGLSAADTERSPFSRPEQIAAVEPLESDGRTVGARVLFRRPGLDPDRLRRAVDCHQARAAALGYPPRVMSDSPMMVAPSVAVVEARGDLIAVTITARRDEDAAAVLGRAKALLGH